MRCGESFRQRISGVPTERSGVSESELATKHACHNIQDMRYYDYEKEKRI